MFLLLALPMRIIHATHNALNLDKLNLIPHTKDVITRGPFVLCDIETIQIHEEKTLKVSY